MKIYGKVNIISLYISISITAVLQPLFLTVFFLLIARQFQIDSVTQR